MMKDLLNYLTRSLVNNPDDVSIQEKRLEDGTIEFSITVNPDDMGRVIGRNGKTARALRNVMSASGSLKDVKTQVEIVDVN